ncbi:MAG: hypothetical protein AAB466_06385 [Verrucomicrobiota bacterium]
MQKRQSSFQGDRPPCPLDPHHTVHRHGSYTRWANCNDDLLQVILRFLCTGGLHTISVLPDDRLPYRTVSVPLLEKDLDARLNGTPPPAATVNEKGCLKRAWRRFTQRLAALAGRLGQMLSVVNPTPKRVRSQLRRWGNLPVILLQLARPFNTSLLHDYLCLLPWSADSP